MKLKAIEPTDVFDAVCDFLDLLEGPFTAMTEDISSLERERTVSLSERRCSRSSNASTLDDISL